MYGSTCYGREGIPYAAGAFHNDRNEGASDLIPRFVGAKRFSGRGLEVSNFSCKILGRLALGHLASKLFGSRLTRSEGIRRTVQFDLDWCLD